VVEKGDRLRLHAKPCQMKYASVPPGADHFEGYEAVATTTRGSQQQSLRRAN
jgi:hypothetical protein